MTHRKDVLPNGIGIVTEVMPHVRSVAVGIWVDTGSRVEPEERGGISHLIEHLVFKGTETRSAEDIARAIDSVGGQMDAFTAKEQTCFYVSVLDEHLPLAVATARKGWTTAADVLNTRDAKGFVAGLRRP